MELFSTGSTTVSGLSNVTQFAVAVDGKLSYFAPSLGSVAFAALGERKVSVEIEGNVATMFYIIILTSSVSSPS